MTIHVAVDLGRKATKQTQVLLYAESTAIRAFGFMKYLNQFNHEILVLN